MTYQGRFMCSCQEEGREECDQLLIEVMEKLGTECSPTTEEDFLGRIIISLEFDYNARLDSIVVDQWFGVGCTNDEGTSIFFQCDDPRHGLAACWKWFSEQKVAA